MKHYLLSLTIAAGLLAAGRAGAQAPAADFQAGDRILLRVEGDSVLSDTFTVVAGPALRLPSVGEISLAGVHRADLETYLTRELSRYLKDPVVHARALIRVAVLGEVLHPGFYAVPLDLVLADALMVAGGPTQDAKVDKLRIVRSGASVWSGSRLQTAIARGSTLEDLRLRAGDRIEVPGGRRDPESKWRTVGMIVTTVATAVTIITVTSR
ncbi:MAG TPA: polysaccharide biosynthesis/export family protein [Gemmatimonadales bacterium]|jgi:polysaccharide export outer membrane protein|nr:polysaccharide biosynthesis/export family protein [Gemmatimonadales bacterium]